MRNRGGKELWGLVVLFVVLVGLAAYYEQVGQEKVAPNAPSVNNSDKQGVRALFLLFQKEGFAAEELKAPWNELTARDGLLVFVEPPDKDRPITADDMKALEKWIRNGGTLLDLVSEPPIEQPLDPGNSITGDSGAAAASPLKHEVPVSSAASTWMKDIHALSVASSQRLILAKNAPYTILAKDEDGILAIVKPLDRGRVIEIANRYGATNEGIREADNAILFYNIAKETAGNSRTIQFDEYHHGVGFDQVASDKGGSLWESVPMPMRLVLVHILGFGLLLIYNSNRRFGVARYERPVTFRSSTDYVNSMARLYRRAGASDIAFEILYTRFVRDMKRALDLPAETGIAHILRIAEQKYGPSAGGLRALLAQGEEVAAGKRLHEKDMLHLARQIEHFRRILQLVGV